MSTHTQTYTHTCRHTHTHAFVFVHVCVRVFCLFLLKNKQIKPKNDASNEGRGESSYHIIYTSLGPCLHHRQVRVSFSEWACGVVNGGARPPKASD